MRHTLLMAVALAAVAVPPADGAISVRNTHELSAAVAQLRDSGGTIVMAAGRYEAVRVGPRSPNWLNILARPGARTANLELNATQAVRISGLRIRPFGRPGRAEVIRSRAIRLEGLSVLGGQLAARLVVNQSVGVTIVDSSFSRCGEGRTSPPAVGSCLRANDNRGLMLATSSFHECIGCDFVHGDGNAGFTILRSSFVRAHPGPCGEHLWCNHQDLIDLNDGSDLVIEGNHFGLQRYGAAQIYLTGSMRRVRITNNVFIGWDPAHPGYMTQIGIWVGNRRAADVPRGVAIVNNTILSGAERVLGGDTQPTNTSVYLSPLYPRLPIRDRPLLANNVLHSVATPYRLCSFVRESRKNVVLHGQPCGSTDVRANARLTPDGQPTAASTALIDRAAVRYATSHDRLGRPRGARPDIGAYEFAG